MQQNSPAYLKTSINPSLTFAAAASASTQLQNEGLALEQSGQYVAAENKYLESLDLKLKYIGANKTTTGISRNALGELYTTLNRLDEAEKHLELAVKIRNADGPTFDAAVSRENLAIVYEKRGDLLAAKQMRKSTGKYACSNYNVCICRSPSCPPADDYPVSRTSFQQERA